MNFQNLIRTLVHLKHSEHITNPDVFADSRKCPQCICLVFEINEINTILILLSDMQYMNDVCIRGLVK